jgi:hypothetical protein
MPLRLRSGPRDKTMRGICKLRLHMVLGNSIGSIDLAEASPYKRAHVRIASSGAVLYCASVDRISSCFQGTALRRAARRGIK